MCKKFMDWFIEKFCPVVMMILLVFVIELIGILCYNLINEAKQDSEAKRFSTTVMNLITLIPTPSEMMK